jgi:hypothetical protein
MFFSASFGSSDGKQHDDSSDAFINFSSMTLVEIEISSVTLVASLFIYTFSL